MLNLKEKKIKHDYTYIIIWKIKSVFIFAYFSLENYFFGIIWLCHAYKKSIPWIYVILKCFVMGVKVIDIYNFHTALNTKWVKKY